MGWIGLAFWLSLGLVGALRGYGMTARGLVWLTGLVWFSLTNRYGFRFGWGLPPWRSADLLIARRGPEDSAKVRVVVQTPLGQLVPPRAAARWWNSRTLFDLILGLPWSVGL